jgi:hypothetical protein
MPLCGSTPTSSLRRHLRPASADSAHPHPPPELPAVDAHQPHALSSELGKDASLTDRHVILVGLPHTGKLVVAVIEPPADIPVRDGKPLEVFAHTGLLGRPWGDTDDLGSLYADQVTARAWEHHMEFYDAASPSACVERREALKRLHRHPPRDRGGACLRCWSLPVKNNPPWGISYVCPCGPRHSATDAEVGRLAGQDALLDDVGKLLASRSIARLGPPTPCARVSDGSPTKRVTGTLDLGLRAISTHADLAAKAMRLTRPGIILVHRRPSYHLRAAYKLSIEVAQTGQSRL